MQKNKFILLSFIFLAACSQNKQRPTLLSKLRLDYTPMPTLERKLASSGANQCFGDIFNVETLKESVQNEEKRYAAGKVVKGTWKHLDLSTLPIPQANFLKTYGDQIGDLKNPDSIDYSACDSVPCVFNRIYGKENHVAGYVHYLWYLKFGHMLSADNLVPQPSTVTANNYNGATYKLADYLYNDDELYGLWRLTVMLDKSHTILTGMKETQRIPRTAYLQGYATNTCGLAFSQGYILLQDACLKINPNDKDYGYLYQAVTHEINHQIDYQQGLDVYKSAYRSEQKDYLDLTGFSKREFRNTRGEIEVEWALAPTAKVVSLYAKTSPAESFAEDLALFRHAGDTTQSTLRPDHFSFISDNYYQKKKFDSDSLFPTWLEESNGEFTKEIFKSIVDCTESPKKYKSTYITTKDFSSPVLPSLVTCLSGQAEDLSQKFKAKFSLSKPEGCQLISSQSTNWNNIFKLEAVKLYEKYLSEIQKDKTYLANIQKFYDHISDPKMALDSYVSCYGEKNEEECFEAEVKKNAIASAMKLGVPDIHAEELGSLYVSYHSYQTTKLESEKAYATFLLSHIETIDEEAERLWQACGEIAQNDDAAPSGGQFQISSGYMVSSYYNCLNAQVPGSIKMIVRDLSVDGINVTNGKEEAILTKGAKAILGQSLEDLYLKAKEEELNLSKEIISRDNGETRKSILADFNWIKDVASSEALIQDCYKKGLQLVAPLPKFHLRKDLYGEYVEKSVCVGLESSNEYNQWLNNSQEEFVNKAYGSLEAKVVEGGENAANACLKSYPVDTAVNRLKYKKEREDCLNAKWIKLEQNELKQMESDPIVKKFNIDINSYKQKLESNRRRLQLKVIKEYF